MRTRALGVCLLVIAVSVLTASMLAASEEAYSATPTPETQGVCVNAKGNCYFYDDRQLEAWVTIGSNHGLRLGAQVAFLRNGEQVAQGEVVTLRAVDCVVKPDKDTPAGTILPGDDVRVTVNGTEEARRAELDHERSVRSWGSLLFSGLLLYTIML